jgi:hypothetical protein
VVPAQPGRVTEDPVPYQLGKVFAAAPHLAVASPVFRPIDAEAGGRFQVQAAACHGDVVSADYEHGTGQQYPEA